jgi:hypothetical protein
MYFIVLAERARSRKLLCGKTLPKVKRIIIIPTQKEQIHFAGKGLAIFSKFAQNQAGRAFQNMHIYWK